MDGRKLTELYIEVSGWTSIISTKTFQGPENVPNTTTASNLVNATGRGEEALLACGGFKCWRPASMHAADGEGMGSGGAARLFFHDHGDLGLVNAWLIMVNQVLFTNLNQQREFDSY